MQLADLTPGFPSEPEIVPCLLERVLPVHEVVPVDGYIAGCPPPADRIQAALEALLASKPLGLQGRDIRFG